MDFLVLNFQTMKLGGGGGEAILGFGGKMGFVAHFSEQILAKSHPVFWCFPCSCSQTQGSALGFVQLDCYLFYIVNLNFVGPGGSCV